MQEHLSKSKNRHFKSRSENFNEALDKGKWGERFLDSFFSRWYRIEQASEDQEAEGIDRIFSHHDKHHTIEYKTDFAAARTGNVFVETDSHVIGNNVYKEGWAHTIKADKLITFVPEKFISVMSLEIFLLELDFWKDFLPERRFSQGEWGAIGIIVPFELFIDSAEIVWKASEHKNLWDKINTLIAPSAV